LRVQPPDGGPLVLITISDAAQFLRTLSPSKLQELSWRAADMNLTEADQN
jgi:hypothetical protein